MRILTLSIGCLVLSATGFAQQRQHHIYTFNGGSTGVFFGGSVGRAGDANKDGFDDLIVGAVGDRKHGTNTGSVRVLSGKEGKILYTFHGDSIGDSFGASVDGAGDVNKDGYDDFIVGAPQDDNNGLASGSARVLSGKDGKILYTFNGDSASDRFGSSVGGAGDVNKDGFPDLIVGAPGASKPAISAGMARVLSGKDGTILYTFRGDSAVDFLGQSVGGAGDVNRDGYDDVLVGAPWDENSKAWPGSVRVMSGKDGKALYTFFGNSTRDYFGQSVGGAGDVNRDGFPDLIVGAYGNDKNGRDSGSACVLSGKDGKILYTFYGNSPDDHFGLSVSGAGDVNKDGFADLIVGASGDNTSGKDAGSVRVLSGKNGNVLYTFYGDSAGDRLGSVGGAGDVNKDGFSDLIVGAAGAGNWSGRARVLSGKALTLTTDNHALSVAQANTQTFHLDAGVAHKGRLYWVFGSITGTSPGVTLASTVGSVKIPLNPDLWTNITIGFANSAILTKTRGALDTAGKAKATFNIPKITNQSAVGLIFYHAYLVYDANNNYHLASNPVTLVLVK